MTGPKQRARLIRQHQEHIRALPPGPLSGLTPSVHALLVAHTRTFGFVAVAAGKARVPERTVRDWLCRGEMDPLDALYGPFFLDMQEAEADFAGSQIAGIESAAKGNAMAWPGRATLLERQKPDMFGRPDQRVKVTQETTVTHVSRPDLSKLSLEELYELEHMLEKVEIQELPPGSMRVLK